MSVCDRCGSASLRNFTPSRLAAERPPAEGVFMCSSCRALVVRTRPIGPRFGHPSRLTARRYPVDAEARPAPALAGHQRGEDEAPSERRDLVGVQHG